MHTRTTDPATLNSALFRAIAKKNEEEISDLLEIFSNNPELDLAILDRNGNNLVIAALNAKLFNLANDLFSKLKDNEYIIYHANHEQKNLAWYAAQYGQTEILKFFLENNHPSIKFQDLFMQGLLYRGSLLHAACPSPGQTDHEQSKNLEAISLLLTRLEQEPNPVELINQPDSLGMTPLTLATDINIIKIFLGHGAMNVLDNYQSPAFTSLLLLSETELVKLFSTFDSTQQLAFIKFFQTHIEILNELQRDQESASSLMKVLYQCAGIYSLKMLAVMRAHFEPSILANSKTLLPGELVEAIRNPISAAKQPEGETSSNVTDAIKLVGSNRLYFSDFKDRILTLKFTIEDLPRSNTVNRALSYTMPLLPTALLSVAVFVLHQVQNYYEEKEDNTHSFKYHDLIMSLDFFKILCGVFDLAATVVLPYPIFRYFQKRPIDVDQTKWSNVLDELKALYAYLEEIKESDKELYTALTDPNQQALFKQNIETLENISLRTDHLESTLRNSSHLVDQLRKNINLSNKPVSFFYQPKELAIEVMNREEEEATEEDTLIGEVRPHKKWGCSIV